MKCYLTNLPQDCGCVDIHDGPHWLHMDKFWFEKNLQMLERDPDAPIAHTLIFFAYAQEEQARLQNKRYELQHLVGHSDARIVLPGGYRESDYSKRERECLRRCWGVYEIDHAIRLYSNSWLMFPKMCPDLYQAALLLIERELDSIKQAEAASELEIT